MTPGHQNSQQEQQIVDFLLVGLQRDTGLVATRLSESSLRRWARQWIDACLGDPLGELAAAWDRPSRGAGQTIRRDVIASLLVTETYFYRFGPQLHGLEHGWLPKWIETGRPVTIWSAGCSTGQEAYTLAGLALQAGCDSERLEIIGTDICEACLQTASEGAYPAQSTHEMPENMLDLLLEPVQEGRVRVRPEVRQRASWRRGDLTVDGLDKKVALVACRNVLIYYDPARRADMVARLLDALEPGGVLLLGHGDSLPGGPTPWGLRRADAPSTYILDQPSRTTSKQRHLKPHRHPTTATQSRQTPTKTTQPTNSPAAMTTARKRTIRLDGDYDGQAGSAPFQALASSLGELVDKTLAVHVHADGAETLDDTTGRMISRAARLIGQGGGHLAIVTSRIAIRRWAKKHGLSVLAEEPQNER